MVWGGYAAWFSFTHVRASYARVTGLVVNVGARDDTRVEHILVRTGDTVKRDQIVATLDKADLEAEVQRAKAMLAARESGLARADRELELTIRESAAGMDQAAAQLAAARARLKQAQAELNLQAQQQPDQVRKAAADLASAKSKLRNAEATLKRMQKLRDEGAVSEQGLDQAGTEQQMAQAAVQSAEAALAVAQADTYQSQIRGETVETRAAEELQARAGVKSAETSSRKVAMAEEQVIAQQAAVAEARAALNAADARLSYAVLRSPINGEVIKGPGRSVKDGEGVKNGEPIVTVLANDIPFWISASVSELYSGRVHEGQPVLIRVDSVYRGWFGGKAWLHGKIDKVGAATEFSATATGESSPWMVQQVPLRITFDREGLPIKHGATCRVWIDIRK
jgi:multidrug resistance efflux pump